MIYENLRPIGKDELLKAMPAGGERAAVALVRMALFEEDQPWAEQQCLAALASTDAQVRLAAVTCSGHLARLHRSIDLKIVAALEALRVDGLVRGMVDDALEDVRIFTAEQA